MTQFHSTWKTYLLYGINLLSDFPFNTPMLLSDDKQDIIVTCVDEPPIIIEWERIAPIFSSPFLSKDGSAFLSLYRLGTWDVFRFPGIVTFYLCSDRILCYISDSNAASLIETHLLSTIMAFWLECRGTIALHASAVVVENKAVAFLAHSGSGKSTLAVNLLQSGARLLCDDILSIVQIQGLFYGVPAYPQLRIWPEVGKYFLEDYLVFDKVHPSIEKRSIPIRPEIFGSYNSQPELLSCFYLPMRKDDLPKYEPAVQILPLSPRDSILEFVRFSFMPRTMQALDFQPKRLKLFTDLAQKTVMRRIIYRSGQEYLPLLREAVYADLAALHKQLMNVASS